MAVPYFAVLPNASNTATLVVRIGSEGTGTAPNGTVYAECTNSTRALEIRDLLNSTL